MNNLLYKKMPANDEILRCVKADRTYNKENFIWFAELIDYHVAAAVVLSYNDKAQLVPQDMLERWYIEFQSNTMLFRETIQTFKSHVAEKNDIVAFLLEITNLEMIRNQMFVWELSRVFITKNTCMICLFDKRVDVLGLSTFFWRNDMRLYRIEKVDYEKYLCFLYERLFDKKISEEICDVILRVLKKRTSVNVQSLRIALERIDEGLERTSVLRKHIELYEIINN